MSKDEITSLNEQNKFLTLQLEGPQPQIWLDHLGSFSKESCLNSRELTAVIEVDKGPNSIFLPQMSEGDVLLYSSVNFYLFIRFFFTVYERILLSRT